MNDPVLGMLALAAKAGKLVYGAEPSKDAMRCGVGKLLIIAGDTGNSVLKNLIRVAEEIRLPYAIYSDKFTLGHATGKGEKSALLVKDENFSAGIQKQLNRLQVQTETEVANGKIK